jgi:hypothetical protein
MLIAVPSPKAQDCANYHREYDYSSDLRPAKQGSGVSLHGSNPEPLIADVRFGSKADIEAGPRRVRFTPKSGHCWVRLGCPLCARSGHYPSRRL